MSDDWAERTDEQGEKIEKLVEKNRADIQKYVDSGPKFEGDPEHRERFMDVVEAWPRNPNDPSAMNAYRGKVAEWNSWRRSLGLQTVKLRGLNMPYRVHLERMDLSRTDLSNGRLMLTNFTKSDLSNSNFSDSDLTNCTFDSAHLSLTNFERSKLSVSSFERANLTGATGIVFDRNFVLQATIAPTKLEWRSMLRSAWSGKKSISELLETRRKNGNPWLTLTRAYSGSKYLVHLALIIAFFTPFAIEAAWWSNYDALVSADPNASAPTRKTTVLAILSGWDESLTSFLATIVFVLYHACRAFVTVKVSSLRDTFEPGGFTPGLADYKMLYQVHVWFLGWFQLVALVAFVVRMSNYLLASVSVPL